MQLKDRIDRDNWNIHGWKGGRRGWGRSRQDAGGHSENIQRCTGRRPKCFHFPETSDTVVQIRERVNFGVHSKTKERTVRSSLQSASINSAGEFVCRVRFHAVILSSEECVARKGGDGIYYLVELLGKRTG